jgi:prepilin-type N-terminal cleavage/methylation domain-containing protein
MFIPENGGKKMSKLLRKIKNGFTLVELIVVIAIIAILAAVSVGGYFGFLAYANQSAADQEAQQFKTSVVATFSVNYPGRTISNANWYATNNNNGIRIYNDVDSSTLPSETQMLSMLCEAYTYSEAPTSVTPSATINYDGLLICDGSQTDGNKAAIYDAKLGLVDGSYFITSVTYQSKKKKESVVNFTSKSGVIEVAPAIEVPVNLIPQSITISNEFQTSYSSNEEIDLSKISGNVTFSDGSVKKVSADKLEISVIGSDNVTYYKGLKKAFGAPAGITLNIKVAYRQTIDAAEVISAPVAISRSSDVISPLNMQDALNVQKSKRVRAFSSSSLSGFFEDSNFVYTVGKENKLYYKPIIIGINESGKQVELDNNIYYSLANVVGQNNDISGFAESATEPNYLDFSTVPTGNYVLTASSTGVSDLALNIKVVDAYNVSNQKDLMMFDNTTSTNYLEDGNSLTYAEDSIFSQIAEADQAKYHDYNNTCKGLVLQDDIKLYPNFLPANTFDANGYIKKGMHLLKRSLKQLTNNALNSFLFEGNYYTIDVSQLPLYKQENGNTDSQPTLFAIKRFYEGSFSYGLTANDQYIMQHMTLIGNAPKSSNTDYWGGLTLVKNRTCLDCQLNYVNARRAFIVIETVNNSAGAKINKCKFYDSFNTFIFNDGCGRVGNRARSVVDINSGSDAANNYTYQSINAGIVVTNSELVSAGGPLVISSVLGNSQKDFAWNSFPTVSFTNCVLSSLAKGAEAYYTMLKTLLGSNPVESILANDDNIQQMSQLGGKTKSLQNSNEMFNCISAIVNFNVFKTGTDQGYLALTEANEQTLFSNKVGYIESDISIDGDKYVAYN